MENEQRKIARDRGLDTHVRDHADDIYKGTNHGLYSMLTGEIEITQPEPLFKQNMVTVRLARGGKITEVGYPGAFKDPVSGNIHGIYEGPIKGQMVVVGFENGNKVAPFVVNRYPYQGAGNSSVEMEYINPLTKAGYDPEDVIVGHFSGSFLSFNSGISSGKEPGSVTFNIESSLEIESKSSVSMISELETIISSNNGGEISVDDAITISGSGSHSVKSDSGGEIGVGSLIKIANTTYNLKTLISDLIVAIEGVTTIPAVVGSPLTLNPASIAALEAEKAKFAALLE
jgi:hypothetical protein